MDSPASDTPRQSLLAFLGRPSRPRTLVPPRPQSQSQDISQSQSQSQAQNLGQRQGIPSNEQQHQNQQQFPNPQPPLSATLSQLLPQSPISPRRQTITTAPVATINNNTSTSPPVLSPSSLPMQTGSFGNMLRRRRSATNVERAEANRRVQDHNSNGNGNNSSGANPSNNTPVNGGGGGTGPTHRIRLVPLLESVRSLAFEPISRDVRHGDQPLRIGRFTEHSSTPGQISNKLAFKSKVVSRGHAEVWFENGSFFIKDTKSSSGTFLNNIRLSPPNAESKPFPMKDGDVLQLGVDYQGGTEEMYRCVKIRIELGREWQTAVNAFNLQALQQLRSLANPGAVNGEGPSRPGRIIPPPENHAITSTTPKPKRPALNTKAIRPKPASKQAAAVTQAPPIASPVSDCCICLSSVTICQALFIAPCSHAYHYKCIRPLLQMHHPGFSCPLCRTFANLEADVEGSEFLIGASNGFGAEGLDDQMIVDGEEYEGEGIDIVEEEVEVSDEVDGGAGAGGGVENLPNQGAQGQSQAGQPLLRPRRLSITPEAGAETEAGVEVDGEGDAGSQTDTPPEMMGHHGIGGSAPQTQTHTQAQGGATENGRLQGLIHNPAVDIDPSALRSSQQPILPGQNLRLPVREDDSDPGVNSGVAGVAGYDRESSVPDMVAPFLIREDVGELGGIGSSHGPSAIATLVNKRR